jgi:hypothetical protein
MVSCNGGGGMRGKVTAAKKSPLGNLQGRQEMKMPTHTDLVSRVRDVLEDSAKAGKTITFGEIERQVGKDRAME